jgi:SpoVK/Ycf46/Vps4 family AAA+-type ATPase
MWVLQEALQEEIKAGAAAEGSPQVHMRHFEAALRCVQPSVSAKDQRVYDTLRQKLRRCLSTFLFLQASKPR